MDIADVEQAVRRALGERTDIAAVYLFGSVARRQARADSDVDLAVLYSTRPPSTLLAMPFDTEAELTRELGRPVQIVVLDGAPDDLVHRVLRDGRILLERDRSARIRFEVAARNRYFDMAPTWRRYRKLG